MKGIQPFVAAGLSDSRLRSVCASGNLTGQRGERLREAAEEMGLDGIVSKRRDARYRSGTRSGWSKVKCAAWREANWGAGAADRTWQLAPWQRSRLRKRREARSQPGNDGIALDAPDASERIEPLALLAEGLAADCGCLVRHVGYRVQQKDQSPDLLCPELEQLWATPK